MKSVIKDESPLMRNSPTIPELIIKEQSGDIASEKKKWITLIEQYPHYSETLRVRTFFFGEDDIKRTGGVYGLQTYRPPSAAI